MVPAQGPHLDCRVLAGLCCSTQTLPRCPQGPGHVQVSAPSPSVGVALGLPQQGLSQHFQLNAQSSGDPRWINQEAGESSKGCYPLLPFPAAYPGNLLTKVTKTIFPSLSLAHTLAYFLSHNCTAAATPGDLLEQPVLGFPGHPPRIYSPCALRMNKDLLFLIRDLMILSVGRRLQT